jgi:CheY-like chemotaxis protein
VKEAMAGILLIDDDPDIRVSLAELLRLEGYPVVTAGNGEEGLEKLKSNSLPCVILLDLMMPIMDGWEFRAKQLSEPDLAQLPVVIISATTEIRRHAAELRAAGFVSKPFVLDRLLSVVQRYCQASPHG